VFLTIFLVALVMPIVAERLRLPGVIGLVLGGLVVGPQVLGLIELPGLVSQLGGLGILYLMFLAGLELDLEVLGKAKRHAIVFGLLTFALPFVVGTAANLALGFGVAAAILVGSFWASHTLVAYPIIRRHGLAGDPAVTATLGATIITDSLALMVLAIVVAVEESGSTPALIAARLFIGFVLLGIVAFVLVPKLTLWFFRGLGQDGILRFLFVMVCLLGVSVVADLGGTEPIVGAFFAGLALNRLVPNTGFLMRRIEFVGSAILIPIFLISVGMLVDLSVVTDPDTLLLAAAFTAVTVGTKYAAAWMTGRTFGFDKPRIQVMFSLSVAQAAATLAAAVVGFRAGIIDEKTVNAALLVILVTVIIASWSASRAAQKIPVTPAASTARLGGNVLVPVARLDATHHLLELALMIARADAGTVIPLHVVTQRDAASVAQGRETQVAAEQFISSSGAESVGIVRIDSSIVRGISHATLETAATMVLVGWTETSTTRRTVLGSVVDDVVSRVPAPVVVAHLPHLRFDRVLLVEVKGASPVEIAAAHDLAIRVSRSYSTKVAARWLHEPGFPGIPVATDDTITDQDLVVIAAPGGSEFTRSIDDFVNAAPNQAILAIRSYAESPNGFASVSEMMRD
jgi:Kef-type K+ transport system membrane component KefB/nucleotide-binding universal stress UspA family protein